MDRFDGDSFSSDRWRNETLFVEIHSLEVARRIGKFEEVPNKKFHPHSLRRVLVIYHANQNVRQCNPFYRYFSLESEVREVVSSGCAAIAAIYESSATHRGIRFLLYDHRNNGLTEIQTLMGRNLGLDNCSSALEPTHGPIAFKSVVPLYSLLLCSVGCACFSLHLTV